TRALLDAGVTAIAYETITDAHGGLPLLTPMSEVAGRMSIQVGAFYLQKTLGGRGIILGGVPGVQPGDVVILGGGTVGTNAAAVDQGGCTETTRPTTHSQPAYEVDGVTHYCVANMPGAVPRTSTFALTNATLPYVLKIAERGFRDAAREDASLRPGVNTHDGR